MTHTISRFGQEIELTDEECRAVYSKYAKYGKMEQLDEGPENGSDSPDDAMLSITFAYKDKWTNGEWIRQTCVMSSVKECIEWYGLGKDCDYTILFVEEAKKGA